VTLVLMGYYFNPIHKYGVERLLLKPKTPGTTV
jgi:tryptophan synthase alpha subunit